MTRFVRIVLAGLLAGLACALAARLGVTLYLGVRHLSPAALPITASQMRWFTRGLYAACGLFLFLGGWAAARWSWASSGKHSLAAGIASGFIAGVFLYLFPLQFWAVLQPQRPILQALQQPLTRDDSQALFIIGSLLTSANILRWLIQILLGSTLLAGAGGWLSFFLEKDNWSTEPPPGNRLARLGVYALALNGGVLWFVLMTLMPFFWDSVSKGMLHLGAAQITLDFKHMFQEIPGNTFLMMAEGLYVAVLWALSLWLTPLMVTVGWAARHARDRRLLHWVEWGLWFGGWGVAVYFLGDDILLSLQLTLVVQETTALPWLARLLAWALPAGLALLGLLAGWFSAPESSEHRPASPSFLGLLFAGAVFALLGAFQWMSGMLTFAISLWELINKTHLFGNSVLSSQSWYVHHLESILDKGTLTLLGLHFVGFLVFVGVTRLFRTVGRWLAY